MHISSSFAINAATKDVWNYFLDIPRMAVCVPGMRETVQVDEQTFTVVIDVRLNGLQSTFQGTVAKTAQDTYQRLTASLHLWDAKTASIITGELEASFSAETATRTRVDYRIDLNLRGRLLQSEPAGLDEVVFTLVDQFIQCSRTRIEHPEETPPARQLSWSRRFNRAFRNLIELIRHI